MSTRTGKGEDAEIVAEKAPAPRRRRKSTHRRLGTVTMVMGVATIALGVIFFAGNKPGDKGPAKSAFVVGDPGPGKPAPAVVLPSTAGGTFDLAGLKGQKVLLYFQEGLMCQPCWTQLKDIEANFAKFQALGIDKIVTITVDPLDALKEKVALEKLTTPVLSDRNLEVSKTYTTNEYGMMGKTFNGHSFIVVNEQGVIDWRADYGGPPEFYMYISIPNLLKDMGEGLKKAA